jgi:hypothetical protein
MPFGILLRGTRCTEVARARESGPVRRRRLAKIRVDHQHRRHHLRGMRADAVHGEQV